MEQNKEIITRFYEAFQKRDWQTMQSCYHAQANFYDPVFRNLSANQTKAMWHMLCGNAKDLTVKYTEVETTGDKGRCRWDAWYTFSLTGRKVHNIIYGNFTFKDGLILEHRDQFDFWRWCRMALGTPGVILGWTPLIQGKVRATARKNLDKFIRENPAYIEKGA
jgi:ketosteroid isomerase-like protein